MDYFVKAIPFFLLLIGVELIVSRVQRRALYSLPDAVNNMSCGIFQELVAVFFHAVMGAAYIFAYERLAPHHLPPSPLAWAGVLLGVDFCYYWFHRASHRVALFWALHVVHHQSEEYNLSVALRQSAFGGFFAWIFYLPLALLGFSPEMFLASYSINLLYQFWIHTRAIKTLGPLELVLNTPSHHRVHHGRNPEYLDKNYAGALILWDRLFGTFAKEAEEPVYGIVHPLRSWNPLWANVHVWVELFRTAREAPRLVDKVLVFLMPPGWHPSMGRGEMPLPEPDLSAPKYGAQGSRRTGAYVGAQFLLLLGIVAYFFFNASSFPLGERIAIAIFIVVSILSLGGLFEGKRWALSSEYARLAYATLGIALSAGLIYVPGALK